MAAAVVGAEAKALLHEVAGEATLTVAFRCDLHLRTSRQCQPNRTSCHRRLAGANAGVPSATQAALSHPQPPTSVRPLTLSTVKGFPTEIRFHVPARPAPRRAVVSRAPHLPRQYGAVEGACQPVGKAAVAAGSSSSNAGVARAVARHKAGAKHKGDKAGAKAAKAAKAEDKGGKPGAAGKARVSKSMG